MANSNLNDDNNLPARPHDEAKAHTLETATAFAQFAVVVRGDIELPAPMSEAVSRVMDDLRDKTVDYLSVVLRSGDEFESLAASRLLVPMKEEAVVIFLVALDDPKPHVRRNAAVSLVNTGFISADILSALREHSNDPDSNVKLAVEQAIEIISRRLEDRP